MIWVFLVIAESKILPGVEVVSLFMTTEGWGGVFELKGAGFFLLAFSVVVIAWSVMLANSSPRAKEKITLPLPKSPAKTDWVLILLIRTIKPKKKIKT